MEIEDINKHINFTHDSRHYLDEIKRVYKKLLIFFFLGILLFLYQQRLSLINIIIALFSYSLLLLMVAIDCNRCEKYKYIIEELLVLEDKIIIFHDDGEKKDKKYEINLDEIMNIEYKDGFFLNPYRPDTFFHRHIEKCRLIKIKLNSKKIIAFGFFIDEKKARSIIRTILDKKEEFILRNKIKEENLKKTKEVIKIYNSPIDERYQEILKKIIEEEKFYISKIDERTIINGDSTAIQNLEIFKNMKWEEINFYTFYVNYLSKKEKADEYVEVAYNGTDSKKLKISELKKDINRIRYPQDYES